MKRYAHFLRVALSGALLTAALLQTAFSYADDTEIFFGGALAEEGIKPNVLFLLDDSSSMNCLPASTQAACTARNNSRMEVMKESFQKIVNSASDINIGVMRFNAKPTLIKPIDDIDKIIGGKTYRQILIDEVNKISAPGGIFYGGYNYTPIVPTLYDAALYLRKESGSPKSPITSACQPTHLVLLSDGEANNSGFTNPGNLSSIGGLSPCTGNGAERCGRNIAKHLAEQDQASWILGSNNYVTTHTIGFALNARNFNKEACTGGNAAARFLCEIAKNGGGGYYGADNATELTDAFDEIIRSVISADATFVSASAPVNSFNRLDNRDELYFAVFRPQETDRWPGNLKRYRVDVDGVTILDANGNIAIDAETGFFSTSSRSFWSTEVDGSQATAGGAASKLPAPGSRNLYTFTGDNPNNSNLIKVSSNTDLNTELGVTSNAERRALINYLLGWTGGVEAGTLRKSMGDPLHSSPRLVTYKQDDSSVVIGTNEGMIHVIDTSTGVEQLAFIPKSLLPNVKELMANGSSSVDNRRPYGMDNTVTIWANDANKNGKILDNSGAAETGEFVYAYATMGRGGRNLYALNLTNRNAPRLLWEIIGGTTPGFENLGQTWSTPVRTRIKIGNNLTDVLIFAGGYDAGQDNQAEGDTSYVRREDQMGNSLYIVNAMNGELIWSATKTTHPKMKYSMPSPVRVIDLQANDAGQLIYDSEGTADQIFVGDMGGQVWRFYINNGQSQESLITPANADGVMATLGGDGTNARRFYHAPDVALLNDEGIIKISVNIGSGYRGHPLHTVVRDRFYSLQTEALTTTSSEGVIDEASLADLTSAVVNEAADALLANKSGWMIKLGATGEKVLSSALTVNNIVYFNTYEPTAIADSCQANVGTNRAYSVKLRNATPITSSGETPSGNDRFKATGTSGLLPDPVVVSIRGKNMLVRFPAIEPLADEPEPSNFWIDITESH